MDIKRCERGHFYDAETNICCPQCAVEQGAAFGEQDDFGPTMPGGEMGETGGFGSVMPGSGADEMEDFGPTMPGGGMGGFGSAMPGSGMGETGDFGPTMPGSGMGGMEDYGSTMPGGAAENGASSAVEDYDGVTEAVDMGGVVGFSPTVGWLVCVEGPARGTDYRIRAGYNFIGRAEHMDICVRGDRKIRREKHALLAYDQEERVFFFGPADGRSIVRVNGKMVMNPQEIRSRDVLTVGATKLMFIPLCGEGFNWDE